MKIRHFSISGIRVPVYASHLRDQSRNRIFLGGQRQAMFRQSPVGKVVLYTSNSVLQVTSHLVTDHWHSPLPFSTHSSFRRYATPLPEFEPFTVGTTGKDAQRDEQLVG